MNKYACRALFLLCSVMTTLPGWVAADPVFKARQRIPNKYIVLFKGTAATPNFFTGRNEIDVEAKADAIAHQHKASVERTWKDSIKGITARMTAAQAKSLARDPDVALVEEDGLITINDTQSGATWGIDRIDQQNLPLDSTYHYSKNGSGVTAYVIDTGILTTHSEFDGRATGGFSAIADGKGASDCNGHGTHVAGTIGGTTFGVAKEVNLVSVRVLDCSGSGSVSGVISGINWVTRNRDLPAVANMSLGGGLSPSLKAAVQASIAAGVTYTVAGGNSSANACNGSPADVPEAITVGATDSADKRASFSNFGGCLDIFAPGVGITSSWFSGNTMTAVLSGTSMATPHVTGAAALYLSSYPGATPAQVVAALTGNANLNKVVNTGAGSANKLLYTGFISPPTHDTAPPVATLTSPTANQTLNGVFNLAANATDDVGVSKVEFFVDNISVGIDTALPYALTWNSASVLNGVHTFTIKATDSIGNASTSPPISASVSNAKPPVVCLTSRQVLLNPGFESGPVDWIASNAAIITNRTAYESASGSWKAKFNGYGSRGTDTLYQLVSIPVDACTASLDFWMNVLTKETTASIKYDTLTVSVLNTSGKLLRKLATYSNLNANAGADSKLTKTPGYVRKSVNLLPYKGQTIHLQFQGIEDHSLATTFLVDNAALNVTQ